ncbi:hypothetical protein ACHAWX_001651 [Stephanocyclus meneghinianus]
MAIRALATHLSRRANNVAVGGRSFSALTAVEEFPGLPATNPSSSPSLTPSITTLPTGLTIVTEPSSLTSTVSLTFPSAGSSNELPSESGAALANRYLSFKSGKDLSTAIITRSLEDVGAALFSHAGRRGATVGYTALRENAAWVAPLLAVGCGFEKWDVRDAVQMAGKEVEEAKANVQVALTDQIYAAAYGPQSSLGHSYYTPNASRPSIISFRERTYTLNGAVLAATGIADHEAFVRMVEEEFPKAAPPKVDKVETAYLGGEARMDAPSTGYTHVALAFSGPTSTPLMNVLKHTFNLSGASAFASPGIFGVYSGSAPSDASGTIDALSSVLNSTPSADVIAKAKASAKSEALCALSGGSKSLADAMTASILDSCTFSPEALAEAYDAISEADVKKALDDMKKGGVSLAAVGDLSYVPYRASLAGRFN